MSCLRSQTSHWALPAFWKNGTESTVELKDTKQIKQPRNGTSVAADPEHIRVLDDSHVTGSGDNNQQPPAASSKSSCAGNKDTDTSAGPYSSNKVNRSQVEDATHVIRALKQDEWQTVLTRAGPIPHALQHSITASAKLCRWTPMDVSGPGLEEHLKTKK